MSVMVIGVERFYEAKPRFTPEPHRFGACAQCALLNRGDDCLQAVDVHAPAAFGGDCMTRDVVYVLATPENS